MSEHVGLLKRRHYRSATPSCIVGALLSYSLMLLLRHLRSSRLCDGSYVLGPTAQFSAIVRTLLGMLILSVPVRVIDNYVFHFLGLLFQWMLTTCPAIIRPFPVDIGYVPGDHPALSSG